MFYALTYFFLSPDIFAKNRSPKLPPWAFWRDLEGKIGLKVPEICVRRLLAGPMFGEPRKCANNDSAHRRSNRLLEHQVVAFPHAQCLVGAYSRCVSLVNVQPYLPNPFAAGNFLGGGVECPVGALAAKFGADKDALDPHVAAVVPVAPFKGEHKAANGLITLAYNKVSAFGGIGGRGAPHLKVIGVCHVFYFMNSGRMNL